MTRTDVEILGLEIREMVPDHMPDEFYDMLGQLVMLAKRASWPAELHAQYMEILAERDEALAEIEYLRAKLAQEYPIRDTAVTHADSVEVQRRSSGPECKMLRGDNDIGPDCGCKDPQAGCVLGIGWL